MKVPVRDAGIQVRRRPSSPTRGHLPIAIRTARAVRQATSSPNSRFGGGQITAERTALTCCSGFGHRTLRGHSSTPRWKPSTVSTREDHSNAAVLEKSGPRRGSESSRPGRWHPDQGQNICCGGRGEAVILMSRRPELPVEVSQSLDHVDAAMPRSSIVLVDNCHRGDREASPRRSTAKIEISAG